MKRKIVGVFISLVLVVFLGWALNQEKNKSSFNVSFIQLAGGFFELEVENKTNQKLEVILPHPTSFHLEIKENGKINEKIVEKDETCFSSVYFSLTLEPKDKLIFYSCLSRFLNKEWLLVGSTYQIKVVWSGVGEASTSFKLDNIFDVSPHHTFLVRDFYFIEGSSGVKEERSWNNELGRWVIF